MTDLSIKALAAAMLIVTAAPTGTPAGADEPPSPALANNTAELVGAPGAPAVDEPSPDPGTAGADGATTDAPRVRAPAESIPLGPAPPAARPADVADAGPEADGKRWGTWGELLRVGSALAGVVGLIFFMRPLLRRLAGAATAGRGGRPSGVVEVLARYPLGKGQHLVLIKVARRVLVLHQSGASMRALSEFTDREEVGALLGRIEAGSTGRQAERFQSLLRTFRAEHDAAARRPREAARAAGDDPVGEIVDLTQSRRRRGSNPWSAVA